MNFAQFSWLKSCIQSLNDSTCLSLRTDAGSYKFSGLCSSYQSHKNLEVDEFCVPSGEVFIYNERKSLLLYKSPYIKLPEGINALTGRILKEQVSRLLDTVRALGVPVPDFSNILYFATPDYFRGFNKEGNPLYYEKKFSKFGDLVLECEGEDILEEDDALEEIEKDNISI